MYTLTYFIKHVNFLAKKEIFWIDEFFGAYSFLRSINPYIKQFKYGGTCICFINIQHDAIYKICRKKSAPTLQKFRDEISIVEDLIVPLQILYEDEHAILYIQPVINVICHVKPRIMLDIIFLFEQFISTGMKPSDMFYKNVGYFNGELKMFDIHDFKDIDSDSSLNTINFFTMFWFMITKKNFQDPWNYSIEQLFGFSKDNFPPIYLKFLQMCQSNCYDKDIFELIYIDIKKRMVHEFTDYQKFTIDDDGKITLFSHTKNKAEVIQKYVEGMRSVLDAGCSLGGIGAKIAQDNPNLTVVINNITQSEIERMKTVIELTGLKNITVNVINVVRINRKYDLTAYFAIFHHLLAAYSIEEIVAIVRKQTNKIAIIELPFKGDALLENVVSKVEDGWETRYNYLTTPEAFIDKVQCHGLRLIECNQMDYPGSNDLNRYYFVFDVRV